MASPAHFPVSADISPNGTSSVYFMLASGVFPGPLPPRVTQQFLLDLAARPSFTDSQSQSDLGNQFGTLFALNYLQSPQEATQLFWQEAILTRDLILAGGDFRQFQSNFGEWKLSHETSLNPLYTMLPGHGMALLECEALLTRAV